MKRFITPLLIVLSFMIPMVLMLIVLRTMGFYPSGEKSLLIMDMAGQVVQSYEHLRYIVSGDANTFFSWSKSYGTNYTGFFAFYLSNPPALMTLLFDDIQLGVFWLTVLSISLCGASSFVFFYYIQGCRTPAVLLFTTSYAMMSYNIAYSLSPMWINAVIMLPVIITGAHIILRGGKPWTFIISTALLLIFNYYTGYMACLFTVLYTICLYFSKPHGERALNIPQALGIFAVSFTAALGLAAWLLIPVYHDLTAGKLGYSGYVPPGIINFPIGQYIKAFMPQTYSSISVNGVPMLYTGLLSAVMCVFYFISPAEKLRSKLLTGGLFAVLLCSFLFIETEIIWHIFQYPNWFPFRYAFVFQFLAVATACKGYMALTVKGFPALSDVSGRHRAYLKLKPAILIMLLILVCLDTGTNAAALFDGLDRQFRYKPAALHEEFVSDTTPVIKQIQNTDRDFYRIEKTYIHTLNDALSLGYKGIAHYSSMFSRDILSLTKQLGMAQSYFWNGYIGSTPATDALFNVKYILSKTAMPYDPVMRSGDIRVYQNPYVLPVAFYTDKPLDMPGYSDNCFAVQNEIYRQLGSDDIFMPVENVISSGNSYTFISNGMPVYAYFPAYSHTGDSLYVNDELLVEQYMSGDHNNAVYIGTFEQGTDVTISLGSRQDEFPPVRGEFIYTLDEQVLSHITDKLRADTDLRIIKHGASALSGTVTAQNDGYLFISIPYDDGWNIKIGGEPVDAMPALRAFMAVPVSQGSHTVEMNFTPPGLITGVIISSISVLGLIGAMIYLALRPVSKVLNISCRQYPNAFF